MFAPTFTTRFTATLAATLCFAAATPAFAGTAADNTVRQRAVYYSDLDLTTQSGKQELRKRINIAASTVCDSRDLGHYVSCRNAAVRNSQEPVGVAIAKAENKARYADAGTRIVVGN